jgi:hypothetical protein
VCLPAKMCDPINSEPRAGEVPERSIGAVSKTVVPFSGTEGSNPSLSANIKGFPAGFERNSRVCPLFFPLFRPANAPERIRTVLLDQGSSGRWRITELPRSGETAPPCDAGGVPPNSPKRRRCTRSVSAEQGHHLIHLKHLNGGTCDNPTMVG